MAISGFILALTIPLTSTSLIGFGMIGLGLSNVVPILTLMASRQHIMPAGLAIASVTTIGYAGILTGPAAIGFIAYKTNLSLSLGTIVVLLLFLTCFSQKVTKIE